MAGEVLEASVKLDPDGKPPWVSIEFGHARLGAYRIYLTNPTETQVIKIDQGRNDDPIPDRFAIGRNASNLTGYYLTIDGMIAAIPPESDPEGAFSVTVKITQDGAEAQNSPVNYPQPGPGKLTAGGVGAMLIYITFT